MSELNLGDKLRAVVEKFKLTTASSLLSSVTSLELITDSSRFYDEESRIAPKYLHLETPAEIKAFLNELKSNSGTKYYTGVRGDFYKFCIDSLRYANSSVTLAQPVLFNEYWPTFRHLHEAQKKWYFYWRKEVLHSHYIDCEISYIFLFVYELLNYTFNERASFNLSLLEAIYFNYFERYPSLTNYLPKWIGDFCYELGEFELEQTWNNRARNSINPDYDYLKQHENELNQVSITYWKHFFHFQPTNFFPENKNFIYKIFKSSVQLLKDMYDENGNNLIDTWMPETKHVSPPRDLFQSAVIGRKTQTKQVVHRTPREKMSEQLLALFKLSENVARVLQCEKRLLNVKEDLFPEGLKERILMVFEATYDKKPNKNPRFIKVKDKETGEMGSPIPKPPDEPDEIVPERPIIVFDSDRINELDKQSKELIEIFAARYKDDADEIEPVEPLASTLSKPEPHIFNTRSDEDYEGLIEALSPMEKEVLMGFTRKERTVQEVTQFLKSRGMMLGLFLSNINEKAIEYLGDNLIEQEDNLLLINEEFQDLISQLD